MPKITIKPVNKIGSIILTLSPREAKMLGLLLGGISYAGTSKESKDLRRLSNEIYDTMCDVFGFRGSSSVWKDIPRTNPSWTFAGDPALGGGKNNG